MFGQSAPNLGTASTFALFTSVGAFSNIGAATTVTGDVGTNVGAFTAFPPGTLVGQKHVADPASAQAATDVASAYSYLNGLTCGPVIGVTLGSGQILTPNVYCIGAAATLNGSLILDGGGDPDALFIFKINGALSTATFATVTLINSASLCNVYWQINGAFSLGDSSVFRGTLLVNGQISLLEGSSLFGRGLSTAGAIDLHNNIVTIGTSPTASTISASGPTTFCQGDSVTLTASSNSSYLWSTGASTQNIIVTTSGSYSVTLTNSCGSASSAPTIVTVNPVPTVTITPSGSTTICPGNSLTLSASAGASYLWSTGATTQTIIVTAPGNYTVTISNGQCIGSAAITIYSSLILNLGNDTTLCGCILLNAYISGGTSYTWCGGTFYPTLNVCTTGVYCVTVSNGTCIAADTINITIYPQLIVNLGNDTTILFPATLTLNAGNPGASYLWSTGATTQTTTQNISGTYYVTVTNQYSCTATDTIVLNVINGINENIFSIFPVSIYPNPGNDKNFTLNFEMPEKGTVEIRIMNQLGGLVYADKLENFKGTYNKKLQLKNSVAGIYFIEVTREENRSTTKLMLD